MSHQWIQGAAMLLALAAPVGSVSVAAEIETDSVIDGVIARCSVIYGTKITYEFRSETKKNGQTIDEQNRKLTLAVQGRDWLLRHHGSPNFRLNRENTCATYYEIIGKDKTSRALHLEDSYSLLKLMNEHCSHAAPRLGTLWFEQQAEFIDARRKQAIRKPDQLINGIPTHVIEWPVELRDIPKAMVVVPRQIAVSGKGHLRIYAAPTLNWALPQIEYCSASGRVEQRTTADKFEEVADDVYFPKHAVVERFASGGPITSCFEVSAVEFTNEVFPRHEFEVSVPPGTRVRDSRPGMVKTTFSLEHPSQVESINQVLGRGLTQQNRWTTRRTILALNAVFVLTLLSCWMYVRCQST